MNWDQIRGNWKQFQGQFRQKWGKLTGSDLEQAAGAKDRLIGLLQERYGKVKSEAERELEEFVAGLKEAEQGGEPKAPDAPPSTAPTVREP